MMSQDRAVTAEPIKMVMTNMSRLGRRRGFEPKSRSVFAYCRGDLVVLLQPIRVRLAADQHEQR
jgi:hypothetical protein